MITQAKSILNRRYLYRPPDASNKFFLKAPWHALVADPASLPAEMDLRPLATPVRDQGQEGACSGFATAAFKEICAAVWGGGKAPLGGYLSPAYLYGRTRMAEGMFPQDSGATISDEMSTLRNYGVCPEGFLPYTATPSEAPTPACDVAAATYRCDPPVSVDFSNQYNVMFVLSLNKPVVFGMSVYQSFENTGSDGIVAMPGSSEGLLGGHALLVVGYKQINGKLYYVVRNSWSPTWGDGGYCYMDPAMMENWMEAWTTQAADQKSVAA